MLKLVFVFYLQVWRFCSSFLLFLWRNLLSFSITTAVEQQPGLQLLLRWSNQYNWPVLVFLPR